MLLSPGSYESGEKRMMTMKESSLFFYNKVQGIKELEVDILSCSSLG